MTTRMVSPWPLSNFSLDVTLIAFPIPKKAGLQGGRTYSSREQQAASRSEESILSLIMGANSGANPNPLLVDSVAERF